jgi:hypothetical protein
MIYLLHKWLEPRIEASSPKAWLAIRANDYFVRETVLVL